VNIAGGLSNRFAESVRQTVDRFLLGVNTVALTHVIGGDYT
jgi:hypothetical protein